jgi:hypothetical protein
MFFDDAQFAWRGVARAGGASTCASDLPGNRCAPFYQARLKVTPRESWSALKPTCQP